MTLFARCPRKHSTPRAFNEYVFVESENDVTNISGHLKYLHASIVISTNKFVASPKTFSRAQANPRPRRDERICPRVWREQNEVKNYVYICLYILKLPRITIANSRRFVQ